MSARLPIVTKRRLRRARRRAAYRKVFAPAIVTLSLAAERIAMLSRFDYSEPLPNPTAEHAVLSWAMSKWGAAHA